MVILLTGKTDVGKSTLLKELNFDNTIHLDQYVKDNLYISEHLVFKQVVDYFGKRIVENEKINTHILGKIVFNNPTELKALEKLVNPYIKQYLRKLKDDNKTFLVEMANYINHENDFKNLVDKVVLITRNKKSKQKKFEYMPDGFNPIDDKEIEYNYLVENNSTISDAVSELSNIINVMIKRRSEWK